jgi:CHASE2 domain-containing sensor protein
MPRIATILLLVLAACGVPESPTASYRVTYRANGSDAPLRSLTYINSQGIMEQRVDQRLSPTWSITFAAPSGRYVYLAVQGGRESVAVHCEILLDGVPFSSVAEGEFALATCDGRLP